MLEVKDVVRLDVGVVAGLVVSDREGSVEDWLTTDDDQVVDDNEVMKDDELANDAEILDDDRLLGYDEVANDDEPVDEELFDQVWATARDSQYNQYRYRKWVSSK
ncbi:MAG: hypothetical protein M1812_006462 [Candelaria pacifica]|nr:MAG: hypothetical protein M1812_006462 [Candelaria pacifica]